jgi:hypothetical protein
MSNRPLLLIIAAMVLISGVVVLAQQHPAKSVDLIKVTAPAPEATLQQASARSDSAAMASRLSFTCSGTSCECKGLLDCWDLSTTGLCTGTPTCPDHTNSCTCTRKK